MELSVDKNELILDDDNRSAAINFEASLFNIDADKSVERVHVTWLHDNGEGGMSAYFDYNANLGKYVDEMICNESSVSGRYSISEVYVIYTDGTNEFLSNIPDFSYKITNNITDTVGPILKSIALDKQGKIIESEEVTVTAILEEESWYPDTMNIDFRAELPDYWGSNEIELLHQGNGVYKATFDTSEWYPTYWQVATYGAQDAYGNWNPADYEGLGNHYFGVTKEGIFVENIYEDVTIALYSDVNGDKLLKDSVKDIPKFGATLGSVLGEEYVDLEDSEIYGKFIGWLNDNTGEVYTKDTVIMPLEIYGTLCLYPKYEKNVYTINYNYLTDKGWDSDEKNIVSSNELTYNEILAELKIPENVGSSAFVKWEFLYPYIDDMENIAKETSYSVEALYDKYPVDYRLAYINSEGKVVEYKGKEIYASGTKIQTVFNELLDQIESNDLANVIGWINSFNDFDTTLNYSTVDDTNLINVVAEYEDKQIIPYTYAYVKSEMDYGVEENISGYIVMDKANLDSETTLNAVYKEVGSISHWDALSPCDKPNIYIHIIDDMIISVSISVSYDNILVYLENPNGNSIVYTGKHGEIIELPTELNGTQVTWYDYNMEKSYIDFYTIPENAENGVICYLNCIPNKNVVPDVGNEDSDIDKPSEQPSAKPEEVPADEPIIEMEEEKVAETIIKIEEKVKESEKDENAQIVVDMKNTDGSIATVVPKEILEAAKNQNVEIVLDMGDYSWTINGTDIKGSNLKDVNLEVKMDTKNIPSAAIDKIAKGHKTRQLSLTYNGDFGFKAELTINVGKDNEGQYGNLYYYDSNGKLVFMNAGKIDENGNVSLWFSHASEYVVVISDKPVVADTSDNTNIYFYVIMLVVGTGLMLVSLKKKNTF